ncbi:MAG: DUF5711 family protein [Oscillospiraceae bacterium]|nr:DUF5711 family protein [Oscillospiraceae bacterium]
MPKNTDEPVIKRSFYEKEEKRPALKISRMLSVIIFIAFFLVVLGGLGVFWLLRDDLDQSLFRQLAIDFSWNTRRRAQTSSDKIIFDGKRDNAYAPFMDGLTVLTASRIVCYDSVGKEIISAERYFKNPCLLASPRNVLAFDRGGDTLVLLNDRSILLDIRTERPIITAKLNRQGYVALVTQQEGYKALLTVMDAKGQPVFKYYSADYIIDAALSPDSGMVAVSYAVFRDDWVSGHIKIFDITKRDAAEIIDEPAAVISPRADEGLISEVFIQRDGKILAVGEKNISFYDLDGVLLNSTDFSGRAMLDYSVMNAGVAVRTARAGAGMESRLDLYGFDGELIGSDELKEEIICQSGGGDYVTLVTSRGILVYDGRLELKSDEPNELGARQILQRDDGTMFLIFNDHALIYSP